MTSTSARQTSSGETITSTEVSRRTFIGRSSGHNNQGTWVIGPVLVAVVVYTHESDTRPAIHPTYGVELDGRASFGGFAGHLPDDGIPATRFLTDLHPVELTDAVPFAVVVRCEDGAVRHDGTFPGFGPALLFADYGHCCTSRHTYEVAPAVDQWDDDYELADWLASNGYPACAARVLLDRIAKVLS